MANDKKQSVAAPHNLSVSVNPDTTPILFTDNVLITANDDGVVLDITQKLGDQRRIVSRIGMSRTHARKFITEASRLLALTENKR